MKRFVSVLVITAAQIIWIFAPLNASRAMTIRDYYQKLPKKYITHTGDYGPSEYREVLDRKNGYLALVLQRADTSIIVFELALFKITNKEVLLVVSNRQQDPECASFETFWLRYKNDSWTDVGRNVLPPSLRPMSRRVASCFHFKLPRIGPSIKFNLVECDIEPFATYTPEEKKELALVKNIHQIHWDHHKSRFVVQR